MQKSKRIFVLSPFQVFSNLRFPEALLLKELVGFGYKLDLYLCDGLFENYCAVHPAFHLDENSDLKQKLNVCRQCKAYRDDYKRHLTLHNGIDAHQLNSFLTDEDRADVEKVIRDMKKEEISDLKYQGYPVGRYASYEFILCHKIADIKTISEDLFKRYCVHLKNTLYMLLISEKLFSQKQYQAVLLYNHAYSINNVTRAVAEKYGVPTSTIHMGFNSRHYDDSTLITWKMNYRFIYDLVLEFGRSPDHSQLKHFYITLEHLQGLWAATAHTVYSLPRLRNIRELRRKLGIDQRYKKIVLLSMSSEDEFYGAFFAFDAESDLAGIRKLFPNQMTWMKEVIHFFSTRPDYKLIVRIHPREFPNKREGVVAQKVAEYEKILSDLPPNIHVNRPEDKVSVYDLFEIIDMNLVGHSSVGFESALMGVEGLGFMDYAGYAVSYVHKVPRTSEEFFEHLLKRLQAEENHSLQTMERALAWSTWFYTQCTYNFSSNYFSTNFISKVVRKIRMKYRTLLQLHVHSISAYMRSSEAIPSYSVALRAFMDEQIEFHEARRKIGPEVVLKQEDRSKFLRQYIRELFALYYDIPGIDDKTEFEIVDAEAITFQKFLGRTRVKIPKDYKLANFLARFMTEVS